MIIGIVAVDRNGAIGKDGKLPWHYSADMKFFKKTTIGNACVMGYRTWLTFEGPLKDRLNIVLSRRSLVEAHDSLVVIRDFNSVLSLASYLRCDLFVMGGQQIYRAFLSHIDRWVVTEVPITVEGADVFVPQNYLEGFKQVDSKKLEQDLVVKIYDRSGS
jgi:dihydrofolate reductase